MQIYNVFYASLLIKDPADPLLKQDYLEPLPVKIKDREEWETEEIINIRRINRALKARVKWVDWLKDLTYYSI